MRSLSILAVLLALLTASASAAGAASLLPIGKFDRPSFVTADPGDPDRLFVVERKGRIQQVENGVVSPFANIESVVSCCAGEGGLLSIAVPEDFDSSGRLYVFYTGKTQTPGEIHIAELPGFGGGALRNLLTISHPIDTNHYGGQLQFGPDSHLYIATGDGGGADDVHKNSQDLDSLLGKILRIDPLQSGADPYTVPAGNPFPGNAEPFDTIWSYGLRNPFRFSFDRLTGDLTIGDVGQGAREEVDFAAAPGLGAGANYGWNCREGAAPGPATDPQCPTPASPFVDPVFDYPHTPDPDIGGGDRCAVIGGYVARDPGLGALDGRYLYADLCSGAIRALALPSADGRQPSVDCWTGLSVDRPVSFGEDSAGRIYVVSEAGTVYRLQGPPPASCPAPVAGVVAPTRSPPTPRSARFLGIRAAKRSVERGGRALITVFVSPCQGKHDDVVTLRRGRRSLGGRHLNRVCSARFWPLIRRASTFRATIGEDAAYLPASSRPLKIRASTHRHHHRR
jgi:glucose/arabinose dehydrogenase